MCGNGLMPLLPYSGRFFVRQKFFTIFVIQCKVTKICSHKHLFENSACIYQLNSNIVIETLSMQTADKT